jgi:putative ABC transport system permease protein
MWRDFVLAFRVLKKSPIATAVTILALALGIGANVGSFTAVNAILLHPFPYPNLDKIITVRGTLPKDGLNRAGITAADFEDWRQRNRSFELLSAYEPWTVNLTDGDRPEPLQGARVGAGFFQVFGMKPSIGRTFTESENESGSTRVVVLSNELWRTRFAAAPDITGKTISLGGRKYAVVGVMPNDFDYPLAAEVWVPLVLTPAEKANRLAHNYLAVGMLKAGVNASQADAEIRTIAAALEQDYPKTNTGWSAAAAPFRQMAESVTNWFIEVLSIASLFLLLLAGANVANIQLAQAMNRQKTIVIEASLGASSFRIARSLCSQSILLALCGGAAALIAATWMNDANRASIPARIYQIVPGLRQLRIDSTVILFTLALSLLTGVLCSLPAIAHLLRRSSLALTETLSQGSRSVAGDSRHRMRDLLVIGEIAMALLLLVGAGVMVNTFQHMLLLNLGFNPSKLLTAQISLAKQTYPTDAQVTGLFERLVGELSTIRNVQSASLEMSAGAAVNFRIEDRPEPAARDPKPDIRMVDASYFRTMEMPVIAGRAITEQDTGSKIPHADGLPAWVAASSIR